MSSDWPAALMPSLKQKHDGRAGCLDVALGVIDGGRVGRLFAECNLVQFSAQKIKRINHSHKKPV